MNVQSFIYRPGGEKSVGFKCSTPEQSLGGSVHWQQWATRSNARVYRAAEVVALTETLIVRFARLSNHFEPDTLAKIVIDLGDGPLMNEIEEAQKTAMNALVVNVGEEEARGLIEEVTES